MTAGGILSAGYGGLILSDSESINRAIEMKQGRGFNYYENKQ